MVPLHGQPWQPAKADTSSPLRACGKVRSIQTIDKQVLVAKQAGLAGRIEHVVSIVGGDGAESTEL